MQLTVRTVTKAGDVNDQIVAFGALPQATTIPLFEIFSSFCICQLPHADVQIVKEG